MPHIASLDISQVSPYNAEVHVVDARAGIVRATPRRDKVALIGASSGKVYAPYDDPEWEVWSLNAVPSLDRFGRLRVDRWFEMHVVAAQNERDMEWIERCPVPLYLVPEAADEVLRYGKLTRRFDEITTKGYAVKHPVRYPLDAIESQFGSYWACSFAYQIALAVMEGFTDIGIYGAEMCYGDDRERTVEWANVSWWLGFAEGRNINIHLPPGSHLGRHKYRYGIEYYEEKRDVEQYVEMMRRARTEQEGMGG